MDYGNPRIPEGINTSSEHPLKELFILSSGALAVLAIISVLLAYFGAGLARLVPFETELRLAETFEVETAPDSPLQHYLRTTARRVAGVMDLPEGMHIQIHYQAEETINAFATLGGNIILFRGLLELIPDENTLAMLLAHEIAHIENRDPIVSVGRSIGITAGLSILMGDTPSSALGNTGLLTQLYFSRQVESLADLSALEALVELYGHAAGATSLFELLRQERARGGSGGSPAFFSTHPLDEQRIQTLEDAIVANGWASDRPGMPLPEGFADWLRSEPE